MRESRIVFQPNWWPRQKPIKWNGSWKQDWVRQIHVLKKKKNKSTDIVDNKSYKMSRKNKRDIRFVEVTYINFFPLTNIADQSRETQKPDEAEKFNQAQDPQGSARV